MKFKLTCLAHGALYLQCFKSYAVCPICAVVVGAGVGLTKWLGIDDSVTGLWLGALTMAMIIWTILWLDARQIRFVGRKILVAAVYYALVIWPLCYKHFIGLPMNKLWGMDKLVFGIVLGSFALLATYLWYVALKARNGGRAYFPFQKIAMFVSVLGVLSLIFYCITR